MCSISYLNATVFLLWMPWTYIHDIYIALSEVENVCVAWRKCVCEVPYKTHNVLLPFICDDISIIEQIHSQFVSFIASLFCNLSTNNHCLETVTRTVTNPFQRYSSPSILQPSILRPPLIIRPLDLVPRGNFLCWMTFILRLPAT